MAASKDSTESSRRTAHQIYEVVLKAGKDELHRSWYALAISGLAGGLTMGLTALGRSIAWEMSPPAFQQIASNLAYPLGFVAVIIGRAQLFTENTLYPVVLVLDDVDYLGKTAQLWGIVFLTNVIGSILFSLLVMDTSALKPELQATLTHFGVLVASHNFWEIFWSGIIGGWLIALVAWMVAASHWTSGQLLVIYLFTLLVGAGEFAHCIAGSGEVFSAVLGGALPTTAYLHWLAAATLGNIFGGTIIVSLLNWGQVIAGHDDQ